MAPKNQKEATAWAKAHTPDDTGAIAELAHHEGQRAAHAAACVIALTKLGGAAAKRAIATYAPSTRHGVAARGGRFGDTFADPVANAMAAAWNTLRDPEFGAQLFSGVDEIHWANGAPLEHLAGLDHIDGLSFVNVRVEASTSLEPLVRCGSLETLIVSGAPENLEPLRRMRALRKLAIEVRRQAGLGDVASCERLESVTITLGPSLRLAPLLSERELFFLGWPTESPADLEPLRHLAITARRGVAITFYNPTHEWRQIPGGAANDSSRLLRIDAEKLRLLGVRDSG